jgi:hypothetical protein
MRIGDINIEAVPPTRTGLYLIRSKAGDYTGVHRISQEPHHTKPMAWFDHNSGDPFAGGEWKDPDLYDCYGPLMFSGQADKVHTTYKIDSAFKWPEPSDFGTPGRS